MSGYIYLIRLREFANTNEQTYKIGKTTRQIMDRISEYPKDSELYMNIYVPDCHALETKILNKMKMLFVQRLDIGNETFTGPIQDIQIVIMNEITDYLSERNYKLKRNKLAKYVDSLKNKKRTNVYDNDIYDATDVQILPTQTSDLIDLNTNSNMELTEQMNDDNKKEPKSGDLFATRTKGDFYKYIYNERPPWYKENMYVEIDTVRDAYNEFFNQNRNSSIVSRYVGSVLFTGESRSAYYMKKRLASFESLVSHFNDI